MSNLTDALMHSIDYQDVAQRRRANFMTLHQRLNASNRLKFDFGDDMVPMIYPYLNSKSDLREHLIQQKIFVAKYWPNVSQWAKDNSVESDFVNHLIAIPRFIVDAVARFRTAIASEQGIVADRGFFKVFLAAVNVALEFETVGIAWVGGFDAFEDFERIIEMLPRNELLRKLQVVLVFVEGVKNRVSVARELGHLNSLGDVVDGLVQLHRVRVVA